MYNVIQGPNNKPTNKINQGKVNVSNTIQPSAKRVKATNPGRGVTM